MQRFSIRLKYLIEKHLTFVGKDDVIDAKPHGKERHLRLPVSQRCTLVAATPAFASFTSSSRLAVRLRVVSLTNVVWQKSISHLRRKRRPLIYQVPIDGRAAHGQVVRLDLTVVACHGKVLDPSEVRGLGVVRRVAERVFGAGLLFGQSEAGVGVGVTAGRHLELSI